MYELTNDMSEPFAEQKWVEWCKVFEKDYINVEDPSTWEIDGGLATLWQTVCVEVRSTMTSTT